MAAFVSSFLSRPLSSKNGQVVSSTCRKPVWRCSADDSKLGKSELEGLIEKLSHVNKFRRQKASLDIKELDDERTIPSLVALLDEQDVVLRRAAAQTLGVIGVDTIPAILDQLKRDDLSVTKRATCIKTLSAVAMNYPETRPNFSSDAFEALNTALLEGDHVSRLSASICLGLLASDSADLETGEPVDGNARALDVLINCLNTSSDPSVVSSVVMAFGSIAACGDGEKKEQIRIMLEQAVKRGSDEEGFEYVAEIINSELDKLRQGTTVIPPM